MLNQNWLTEGILDFEYKKYLLLAYFQGVEKHFKALQLYPAFGELVAHTRHLQTLQKQQQSLEMRFPQQLSGIKANELSYKPLFEADSAMQELNKIMDFALPKFLQATQAGQNIYEDVAQKIQLHTVGLLPTSFRSGILLLSAFKNRCVEVYEYQVTVFTEANERYRSLYLKWLERVPKGLLQTYESLKVQLNKRHQIAGNPATFLAESALLCPLSETVLPITKRCLMQKIAQLENENEDNALFLK